MSKKQSGAASGDDYVSAEGRGRFARLRSQPGFRTAAVAFVLTVVLGIGGSAAYAYWSLRAEANLVVVTARADLPSLKGKAECGWNGPPLLSNVIISQPALAKPLPMGAAVVMTVVDPRGTTFYVLNQREAVVLKSVPGLEDRLRWGTELTISITTAYLKSPVATDPIVLIDGSNIDKWLEPSPGSARAYYRASFFCN